ncbi:hypothetical protein ACTFIU_008794 [Dictyostelium citrinum]
MIILLILEISLLNKFVFLCVQQILTYNQQLIKFFPTIQRLIVYINPNHYDSKESLQKHQEQHQKQQQYNSVGEYKFKLIQYKEIENLYTRFIQKKNKNKNNNNIVKTLENESQIIKRYFGDNLKHITHTNRVDIEVIELVSKYANFYKFNKLQIVFGSINDTDEKSFIGNTASKSLGLSFLILRNDLITEFNKEGHIRNPISDIAKSSLALIKVPTIKTLHCELYSLFTILQHCKENSNIKHLIISSGNGIFLILSDQLSNLFQNSNIKTFVYKEPSLLI